MFILKLLGKLIAIPMILATTILFYIVCIFARIYGLAAALVNFIAMVGVIMLLFSRDWLQLGITISILVVSYLMLDTWGVVILFIAKIRGIYRHSYCVMNYVC